MADFKLINIGIADIGISESPDILRTILGSCVGICLYDPSRKIGGLAHIMLPVLKTVTSSPKKYADTAIPILISMLEKNGASRNRLIAKIIGGATMFKLSENSMMSEIGRGNIAKVRQILEDVGIKIIAEDVGGDYGRTMDFQLETGDIRIKSIGKPEKTI
jgi:chemotaxis protein CheD